LRDFPKPLITASFYIIRNYSHGEDKWSKSVANGEAKGFPGAENSKNSATRQKNTKFAHTTRQKIANRPVFKAFNDIMKITT